MTCVVALTHPGGVVLGADSLGAAEHWAADGAVPKVWTERGIAIGAAGSHRVVRLAALPGWTPSPPYGADPDELDAWIAGDFAAAWRAHLLEHAAGEVEAGGRAAFDGALLVAVGGLVWRVESDYGTWRPADGVAVIGCGREYAYGALAALAAVRDPEDMNPAERVVVAIRAAALYDTHVGGQVTLVTLDAPPA